MNKAERSKLVKAWHAGDYRDPATGLAGSPPSDVSEALGLEAADRQQQAAERLAEQELNGRAYLAGVEPADLQAAEAAIAAELKSRGRGGFDHPHGPTVPPEASPRDLQDFVDANAPGVPGYAFVVAVAYQAGQVKNK